MSAYLPCDECDGTGWILYRSETVDGELEEAYRLCPAYCTPCYCMGRSNDRSCPRPGTVRYGFEYFCKQHIESVRADEYVTALRSSLPLHKCGCCCGWLTARTGSGHKSPSES